jgi:uncharacterized protein involved in outer membrane biogenesis
VKRPSKRLWRRLAYFVGGAIGLYAVLGFLVVPPIARSVAEKQLSALLHRRTTIGRVRLNPFLLALTVERFDLRDRDGGPFVAVERLHVDAQAASLWRGGVIVREIEVRAPAITIVRETPERYSFTDLIEQFSGGPPDPNTRPARYSLNNIRVLDGKIDFVDRPKGDTHTVRALHVAVPFFSNLPYDVESFVQPAFSAEVNGTVVALKGRTKPFSLTRETALDLELAGLSIPKYMEYVPVALRCTVPSARLDVALSLSFEQPPGQTPSLSLSGRVALRELVVKQPDGTPVLELPRLALTLAPSRVLDGRVALSEVRIERPSLNVRRARDGRVNLAELGPPAAGKAAPAAAPAEDRPFVVEVAETRLDDGTVRFADDAAPAGRFATTVSGITLEVHHFSTAPGKAAAVDARLATEAGETVAHHGSLTLEPLGVDGHVELKGLTLKKYAPYFAKAVLLDLDGGTLDVSTELALALAGKGPEVALTNLGATLAGLKARRRGERRELVGIETLAVRGVDLDLKKQSLRIGEVETHKGRVMVSRDASGALSFATLVPAPAGRRAPVDAPARAPAAPWSVALGKLLVDGWAVRVEDHAPGEPVTLTADAVALTVEDFSLKRGSRATFSLRTRLGHAGSLAASGSAVLDPLAVTVKLDAKALDFVPLQPYFGDRVNILLRSGAASARGTLTLAAAGPAIKVGYRGSAGVDHLATVDKTSSEDFLKWEALYLAGIDLASEPFALTVGELSLSGFYSRLVVDAAGELNARQVVVASPPAHSTGAAADAEPQKRAGEPGPPPPKSTIRVDKVTLQGGEIEFADHFVRPNFSASLHEVGGRVTGLSSSEGALADLDLRAKLENYAPLEITGKLNPLAKQLALDLKVSFRDIDLSPMSPYSGKYAGYNIAKGRLSLDLKYNIAERKLQAANNVFIDQLTLGDRVTSKDATKLPVRLAIALLRDRRGEIHLDLPLSGSLDDPKFNVGRLVLQVLVNLLTKALVSPFALLAQLGGRGEELAYLEFADGHSAIDTAGGDKLKTLAKALADRPALKLDVTGHADPVRDLDGLRRLWFERKVKAQKVKDLTRQGVAVATAVDDVKLEPGEFERYLKPAYKEETFPKPRNAIGMVRDLPPAEMEKLMLTHIAASDDDLRLLARARAHEVKERLLATGVEGERVFVVEPRTTAPEKKGSLRDARVDFALK